MYDMKLEFRLNVLLLKLKFKNIFMNKTSIVCNTQRWRFIFTNIMYSIIYSQCIIILIWRFSICSTLNVSMLERRGQKCIYTPTYLSVNDAHIGTHTHMHTLSSTYLN